MWLHVHALLLLYFFPPNSSQLQEEARLAEKKANPANFGRDCHRHCMCEVPGQVPCSSFVPLPKEYRGKYRLLKKDTEDWYWKKFHVWCSSVNKSTTKMLWMYDWRYSGFGCVVFKVLYSLHPFFSNTKNILFDDNL